jgi:hypothetical protein
MEFELVIRSGTVIDGSGGEPFEADVAVRDGQIAAIGPHLGRGVEEIDARGLLVTPGFVDIHAHFDGQVSRSRPAAPVTSATLPSNSASVLLPPIADNGTPFPLQEAPTNLVRLDKYQSRRVCSKGRLPIFADRR